MNYEASKFGIMVVLAPLTQFAASLISAASDARWAFNYACNTQAKRASLSKKGE